MEDNKSTLVPEIRFKGFTNAWEQRKLSNFKDVRDGTHDSPKFYENGHPLVTSKNLTEVGLDILNVSFISTEDFESINKRSKVDIGDIIFGMIGTIGNPIIIERDDFAIKNVALIKNGGSIPNDFLLQHLKSPIFENYIRFENAGNTQKFLGLGKIRDYTFFIPMIGEMNAIGSFFRTLDDSIALFKRKIDRLKELKAAYLQQMFPQAGERVPRVRFKGFEGDWISVALSDVAERVTKKNSRLESTLPLTISAQFGLIDQNEFFDKQIASKDVSGYFLLKNGEFAYNKSYSNGYPWGAVKRLDKYDMGVLSVLYIVFKPTTIDSEFLVQYYETDNWHTEIIKYAAEGARNHGLLNISPTDFFKTILVVPQIKAEQVAIGNFFRSLDIQITAQQEKLNQLKQLKSAYLQKMFV